MRLNQNLLPLRDYHKAKSLLWDPQELTFSQDRQDWIQMTDQERSLIRRTLGLFMNGEAAVTHDLAPLLIALKREGGHMEEEMFLTAQLFEEAKHVEFFDRVIVDVLSESTDVTVLAGAAYQQLFDTLNQSLDALLIDHSPAAQARAVATYHMIVEGVLAETSYYAIFQALRNRQLMGGFTRGLELVQRDEARHIAFGIHLLTRLIRADNTLWPVIEEQLNLLLPLAQGVFVEVLSDFAPDIPFDLDVNELVQYAGKQYYARVSTLERVKEESLRRPLAMVIEDEEDIRQLFYDVLSRGGFDVLTAPNVDEAIKILETSTPEIMFVDVNMPGRLGTEVLAYVKGIPRFSATKTVVVTANTQVENRVDDLGADLFLLKPVPIGEMLRMARRLTGVSK